MIATVIVTTSLLLAAVFLVAWLLSPGLRKRIERPKHLFASRVRQYDERRGDAEGRADSRSDEED